MDINTNKSNQDNHVSSSRPLSHSSSYQDREMRRYKNRNTVAMENGDCRTFRDSKIKKAYKPYDDESIVESERMTNSHPRSDHKPESTYPYKCYNGNKPPARNVAHNTDRKPMLKPTYNDYSRTISTDLRRGARPKESFNRPVEKWRPRQSHKAEEPPSSASVSKPHPQPSGTPRIKFTFLQESQLVDDGNGVVSNDKEEVRVAPLTPVVGLNPAAVEFTPSTTVATESLETALQSLSLDNSNNEAAAKTMVAMASVPEMLQGFYQLQCRPLNARLSGYPQQQHYQQLAALYGNHNQQQQHQQLLRYGAAPLHSNYFLYNPAAVAVFNGGYSQPQPATANRLIPLGAATELTGGLHLAAYPSYYHHQQHHCGPDTTAPPSHIR